MPIHVNVDNFARAETDRMFASLQADAGGVNRLEHNREPTPIDHQPVIRMNRDTLYSAAVVDISKGATVTVPDAGDRYVSVMVVNEDHYVNRVFHEAGEHSLAVAEFGTQWVAVAVRVLVDPGDADDVAAVNALQDGFAVEAESSKPFELPDYDTAAPRRDPDGAARAGPRAERLRPCIRRERRRRPRPSPARQRGGLGRPPRPGGVVHRRRARAAGRRVRADGARRPGRRVLVGFRLQRRGLLRAEQPDSYSVNNLTAVRNDDGSVTIHFGGDDDRPNLLPIVEGWNYTVRLYRPRPEILDGSWAFPAIEPA